MAMARQDSNPLVAALPPQTDYLTYLTIVEYNLNKDQLLTLHSVLQDTKLTTNIGWDLVQLLLPLLPESELCLQDIAFFGNPRETVLKVAELLDGLGRQRKDSSGSIVGEETKDEDGEDDQLSVGSTEYQPTDLLSLQFQSLLHMLCILHPRIQTKKPSRFLTTSLKAVIIAFMNLHNVPGPYNLTNRLESGMRAILMLIKSLSGSKRPHLPPRRSQSAIPSVSLRDAAPDPEGHRESIASEEEELRKQILQSFFMHVLAAYVHSLDSIDLVDTPLAWSTRHYERKNVVPGKRKFVQAHEVEAKLDRAEANISQLLALAESDLHVSWSQLLRCTLDEADTKANHKSIFTIPDLPALKLGPLYALAAKATISLSVERQIPFSLSIFPEHSTLAEMFVGADADDIERDALIMLGRVAFESNGLGTLGTGADFNGYLRGLLVLASESSLPNIATQISEYTATILHSHPSSDARFDFILDILKDCPAPECNEAAILWLKDEICVAFNPRPSFPQGAIKKHDSSVSEEASNVFTHAATLRSTAPFIFAKPNLGKSNDIAPHTQAKFWLAALNLYYLLCASEILYEALEVHTLCKDFNIESDFVRPLETLVRRQFTDASQGETEDMYQSFIPLMDDALLRLKCLREQKSST